MTKRIENFGPAEQAAGPNVKWTHPRYFLILCLLVLASLAFVLFSPGPASGYVLPGQHMLLQMTKSLGRASGLLVEQKTHIYDGSDTEFRTQFSETLTYRFSNSFRSETVSPEMTRIHVDSLDAMLTIMDDRVAFQDESRFDRYKDLLLFHSRLLLQERLSFRGIDTVITSLGRFGEEPVYIIGAQYPDTTTAQIWLDKETFRPIRLLIPMTNDGEGDSFLEFRYLSWLKHQKLWYPMRIECYENGQLVREIRVEDLTVNPSISDDNFDIELLRERYGGDVYLEGDVPEDRSEIQKALDDFKRRYEH